ncbi:MAG: hypothetical protein RLN63_06525, partial [Miltoncostaeaceae bacterium]
MSTRAPIRRPGILPAILSVLALGLLSAGVIAPQASAQLARTWVSGVGDDANPCSRTAPCRTLAGAITKTASGGEINAIDPGAFGSVTITKPITIDVSPFHGGVLAFATGVLVNITPATTGDVVLRGLALNG